MAYIIENQPVVVETYSNILQEELVSGTNIKTINGTAILGSGNIEVGGGGTSDYTQLTNKPQINSVELTGNKSLSDIGAQPAGDYALKSDIPTKVSELENDSQFVTEAEVSGDLAGKADKTYVDEQLATKQPVGDYATKTELANKADSSVVESLSTQVATNTSDISIIKTKQEEDGDKIDSLDKEMATKQPVGDYALKSDIPAKVSELTNDSNFVTEAEVSGDLAGKADKTYVDEQLALKADSTTVESLSGEVATNSTDISTLKSTVAENGEKIDSLDKEMATKQDTLVSGESIRTINNLSLLGEGNINVGDVPSITVENEQIPNETDFNRVAEAAANNRAVLILIKTAEMTLTSNY